GPPPDFVAVEVQATPINQPQPEYPDFARRAGVEGQVIVRAWVTAEGAVREVQLLRGVHGLLDQAALDAVRRWTFSPARQNNRAVAVWVAVPITFRLN
ncbi:MAG TPA: energy transducer TonB, partial [Rubricoccaceae bacterium]|nr:energy transducer TonB [Rubricoccaceae bacterium]